jgi:hypothetical protein
MPILGTLTAYLNIQNSSDSKYKTALSQALEEVSTKITQQGFEKM